VRRVIGNDAPDRAYLKRVKSILNVINESNFQKQVNKLKFVIQEDNIDTIMDVIINNAVLQVFYVNIFINLIRELLETNFKNQVLNALDDFVSKLIFNGGMKFDRSTIENTNLSKYEHFCIQQKHKVTVISKALFIIHLMKNNMTTYTLEPLTDHLINNLMLASKECNADCEMNDLDVDIILHILLDIKKSFGWEYTGDKSFFAQYTANKKIHFLIERLINPLNECKPLR
jgi:uncharacterized protein YggL (DUF469 family)